MIKDSIIELIDGDIILQEVDAIVNPLTSPDLSDVGENTLSSLIHKHSGDKLLKECKLLNNCPIGQSRMTCSYGLKSKYIIHTLDPEWKGGRYGEELNLRSCYFSCLTFAFLQGFNSIAFPCLSVEKKYKNKDAACISLFAIDWFLSNHETDLKKVSIVCPDNNNYLSYVQAAKNLK